MKIQEDKITILETTIRDLIKRVEKLESAFNFSLEYKAYSVYQQDPQNARN
jgi:hypothetical protein